jgi:hypothetical protein
MRDLKARRSSSPATMKASCARFADLMAPIRLRGEIRQGVRPAGARRDRHDLRGERLHQGASRRVRHRPARAVRRFRIDDRRAGRRSPASTPPTGRPSRRHARFRWPCNAPKWRCKRRRNGRQTGALAASSRSSASPGPDGEAEYFRGEAEGTLVWPPRGTARLRL